MQRIEFRAAQLHFDKLLERVQRGERFEITVRTRPIARLEPPDKPAEAVGRTGNLADFFRRSPSPNSGVKTRRLKDGPRKIRVRPFVSDL